jgi:hypothetical protein
MIQISKNRAVKSSALQAALLAIMASLFTLGPPGFWSGAAWAQDARQVQRSVTNPRTGLPTSAVPAAAALPVRESAGGAYGAGELR